MTGIVRGIIYAAVVAVAVTLICMLVGTILGSIGFTFTGTLGSFLVKWAAAIGILAGLWKLADALGWL